jgi:SAM-dependent methyltransferase
MQALARAKPTFESTAFVYDQLTAHHDYDRWIPRLLVIARRNGLRGTRLLDVACGTGKSFLPLLRAGWSITGCDVSPAMLRRARSKAEGQARLEVADMRRLPRLGRFDLVWAIDDAVNYLRDRQSSPAVSLGCAGTWPRAVGSSSTPTPCGCTGPSTPRPKSASTARRG